MSRGEGIAGHDITGGRGGDDVTGNGVTGNDVTGNDVMRNDVTGNGVTGNDVTGNGVTGNGVTRRVVRGVGSGMVQNPPPPYFLSLPPSHIIHVLSSFPSIQARSLLHSFPTLLTIFSIYLSHPRFRSPRCVLCFTLRHARC